MARPSVETGYAVPVEGVGPAWHPVRLGIATTIIVAIIAGTKILTVDDPYFTERDLVVARLAMAAITFVSALFLLGWMGSFKSRLAFSAATCLAAAATVVLGALHWLGTAFGAVTLVGLVLVAALHRRHRKGIAFRLVQVSRTLTAYTTSDLPSGARVEGVVQGPLSVTGEFRLENGEAKLTVSMVPPKFRVITDGRDSLEVAPTTLAVPQLVSALLLRTGTSRHEASWQLEAGQRISLCGSINWDDQAPQEGGYREKWEHVSRHGVLSGVVEVAVDRPPQMRQPERAITLVLATLMTLVFAVSAWHHELMPPAPPVAELAALSATLTKVEQHEGDPGRIDIQVDVDERVGNNEELEVDIAYVGLSLGRSSLEVSKGDVRWDRKLKQLTLSVHYRDIPKGGRRYELTVALKAERFHWGLSRNKVGEHDRTMLKTKLVLGKVGSLTTYGRVGCPDDDCSVFISEGNLTAMAKPGIQLTVNNLSVPADGKFHRVPVDLRALFAKSSAQPIDHPLTWRLPVEVIFPDGTKLNEYVDLGRDFVHERMSALFRPVITKREAVTLGRFDDAEPVAPRSLLHFLNARDTERTNKLYVLHGTGTGLKSVDLVAVTKVMFHEVSVCRFGNGQAYRTWEENVVTVFNRRTAQQVSSKTFRGTPPRCPATAPSTAGVEGGEVSEDDVRAYLGSLLAR